MSKLSQLLELILMLQYKEFTTASELADILKVDKKTIYRYIETLQTSNIPVESKKGRYGGFYINKEFYMKYPKLNKEELESLFIASEILTKENGFYYADVFQKAITKIKGTSLCNISDFEELRENVSFNFRESGNIENFNDIISKINYAMSKGRVLKVTYFSISKNSQTEIKVNPYTLLCKNGAWYMVAYCYKSGEEETFRVSRIKSLNITDDIFIKPKDFNLKDYLDNSSFTFNNELILVKIKFHKSLSKLIEGSKWLLNQEIEITQDENLLLKGYLSDLGEIKQWVLGFGANAEVLEPVTLRDDVKSELRKVMDIY